MDTNTQVRCREEAVKRYEFRAFEYLALYSYHGKRYAQIESQVKDMEKRRDEAKKKEDNLFAAPDSHTKENREKRKLLRKDVDDYNARIKSVSEMAKSMYEQLVNYRDEGIKALEILDEVKSFKIKTPEEIEQEKKAPVPPAPAEVQ